MPTFLLCPDKFKGSATSQEVITSISKGILKVLPDAEVTSKAISDGGEGFATIASEHMQGEWVSVAAVDALHRPLTADYFISNRTAYIDMSSVNGLVQIEVQERNVLHSSTLGTGLLIKHAVEHKNVDKIFIGLGGSATNDGGAGMAHALGVRFLNHEGKELEPTPEQLRHCASISITGLIPLPPIIAACDVDNPLLGDNGASAIYGPQKGLRDISHADSILKHLMEIGEGTEVATVPGAGAAGGVAYGLMHYCGARLEAGFSIISEIIDLETSISNSDIIITGEGSLDAQTLNGKGPHGVLNLANKHSKPTFAIAGQAEAVARSCFKKAYTLSELGLPLSTCMEQAPALIEQLAEKLASELPSSLD